MLLFLDGQAHYDVAQLGRKWVMTASDVTWSMPTEGRWSSNPCLKRTSTNNTGGTGYLSIAPFMTQSAVWSPQPSGVCGFAFKTQALSRHVSGIVTNSGDNAIWLLWQGTNLHLGLGLSPDGTLGLYRHRNTTAGAPGEWLATSVQAVTDAAWVFLEVKWHLDPFTGYCRVRANGIEILAYTGDTIGYDAAPIWTSVRLLGMTSADTPLLTCWLNDVYLCDQQGSGDQLRDFLGDVRVATIVPNDVGAATQWAPNTGANWAAVDERPADDDTTYVSTATVGHRDLYQYTDLPAGVLPLGFQTCHLVRKDTTGTAAFKPSMRSGGTTHDGNQQSVASDTAYTYAFQPYDTNPVTAARATAADLNAAEFGTLYG